MYLPHWWIWIVGCTCIICYTVYTRARKIKALNTSSIFVFLSFFMNKEEGYYSVTIRVRVCMWMYVLFIHVKYVCVYIYALCMYLCMWVTYSCWLCKAEIPIWASKETCLDVNTNFKNKQTNKQTNVTRNQNQQQSHNIRVSICNTSFGNVSKFGTRDYFKFR
jgi:hypothetical protein